MSGVVQYLKNVRDEVVGRHDAEVFSEGFNDAANLCVDILSDRINELRRGMKSGGIDVDQQRLFAELSDLKDEVERRLRAYPEDA